MKDYRLTEQEQELKRNGFKRDMAFTTEAGAKYYCSQMEKRRWETAIAKGLEPYACLYVWRRWRR